MLAFLLWFWLWRVLLGWVSVSVAGTLVEGLLSTWKWCGLTAGTAGSSTATTVLSDGCPCPTLLSLPFPLATTCTLPILVTFPLALAWGFNWDLYEISVPRSSIISSNVRLDPKVFCRNSLHLKNLERTVFSLSMACISKMGFNTLGFFEISDVHSTSVTNNFSRVTNLGLSTGSWDCMGLP